MNEQDTPQIANEINDNVDIITDDFQYYLLVRDRIRRIKKKTIRYGFADVIVYSLSIVEEPEST